MPSSRRYSRLARVNEALREVVADELELVDDERLELVTVTGARVDPDLRHAVVWYSAMSAPASDEDVETALVRHRVRFQAAVASQLRLKRTPELAFKSDPAIAIGTRVEEIIRGLARGAGEPASDVQQKAAREDDE
jgi:ribosome-binding factor A